MTMPQMPRPGTTTAATAALNDALAAVSRKKADTLARLDVIRAEVESLEATVRTHDGDLRELRAALERLGASS